MKTNVSDVAEQLATTGIWIVDTSGDNENNKRRALPVIRSQDVDSSDVQDAGSELEVDTSNTTDSSVDLSGITGLLSRIWSAVTAIPDFLTNFWTDFKTGVLEIPDILRSIWEGIKNLPETVTQGFQAVRTGLNKLVEFFTGTMFVPSPA